MNLLIAICSRTDFILKQGQLPLKFSEQVRRQKKKEKKRKKRKKQKDL